MDNNHNIEEVFHSAVSIIRNLPKEGPIKPSDELKLKLYAYFKQATHGPNDTSQPRFYQIVESYKWDAWHKLGDMPKTEAMLSYVKELKHIMETIPEEKREPDDNIEAKPFYDYCLGKGAWDRLTGDDRQQNESNQTESRNKGSSSSGSSVSMLDGDHFKEDIDDQIAVAILRLQKGLDETNRRLSRIESDLAHKSNLMSQYKGSKDDQTTAVGIIKRMKPIHWFYISYPIIVYFVIRAIYRRNNNRYIRSQA